MRLALAGVIGALLGVGLGGAAGYRIGYDAGFATPREAYTDDMLLKDLERRRQQQVFDAAESERIARQIAAEQRAALDAGR